MHRKVEQQPTVSTSKRRIVMRSERYGEFDLDGLVDRLCHSHSPQPQERDLYNAQVAILHLIELKQSAPETKTDSGSPYVRTPAVRSVLYDHAIDHLSAADVAAERVLRSAQKAPVKPTRSIHPGPECMCEICQDERSGSGNC